MVRSLPTWLIDPMANFTMSATLKAKPEYRDKIIEIMKSPKGVVVGREAKGNIFFDISLDDQDPNLFRADENWHTKEEWEAFMQLKDEDGVLIAPMELISTGCRNLPSSIQEHLWAEFKDHFSSPNKKCRREKTKKAQGVQPCAFFM